MNTRNTRSKITNNQASLSIGRWLLLLAALALVALLSPEALRVVQAASGDLDTSFGTGGLVTKDLGGHEQAVSIAIQQDGKIVIAGSGVNAPDFAVLRYNPDGSPDASFGTGGVVLINFSGFDRAFKMAIQSDGKIVVVGSTAPNEFTNGQFALARLNPDGSLDGSFGSGGKVTTAVGNSSVALSLAFQSGGRIVVGGFAT